MKNLWLILSYLLITTYTHTTQGIDPRVFLNNHQIDIAKLDEIKVFSCDYSLYEQITNSSIQIESNTIDISKLNDDFCDCPDTGIDETATNACDKGKFYCKSKFAIKKFVDSYFVNDGYCDCCDCSDEFKQINKTDNCFNEFRRQINADIQEIKYVNFHITQDIDSKARGIDEKIRRNKELSLENERLSEEFELIKGKLQNLKRIIT